MATVIITGTSTGIGMATAVCFGRAGHDVFATMRNPEGGGGELRSIAENEGLPIQIRTLDVDSDQSVRDAIDTVIAERGHVDVLVNNAGLGSMGPVEETPVSVFKQVMETNFFGAIRCIQSVLPTMRERKRGCIVNVTSVAGRISGTPQAPYSASKWALEALSESLAQEVKPFDIRVAIVEPGIINTPIFGKMGESPADTHYPNSRRLHALFRASLENPVSPDVVGEQIREIVEGDSRQLRYPTGPDALPFLEWRAGISDEQWVDWGAISDEEWCRRVKQDFGLDVSSML
ncbi:MAG: SDR family oxidoreductase [Gemmatimonadales bacterium]